MEYGPRYQRMMAERRQKQEERERELRMQEDALLKSLDPASVIDDPSQNENEKVKEELLRKVQSERQAPKAPPPSGLPSTSGRSAKKQSAYRRAKAGREQRKTA